MSDNWLSTDDAIEEVVAHCLKMTGGKMELSIRCPDAKIEAKVKAALKGRKNASLVDTYVGGMNDTVKAVFKKGTHTRSEPAPDEGDDTPITRTDDEYAEMASHDDGEGDASPYESLEQIADCKHDAQMADLTPDDELDGLV